MDKQSLKPKSRNEINEVIISYFNSLSKKGKVFDAPGGHGYLASKIKNLGFNVTCGEIEPSIFKAEGIDCIFTDLNKKIDCKDEYFDYVTCVDGIEHMTDPYIAVQEFSRVLKPGGYAVFSIPNYSNIAKRIKYFFKGYLEKPKRIEDYINAGGNLYNFHNSPLNITLLNFMFSINGFKIEKILRDKFKIKQFIFFFPIVLILKIIAMLSPKKYYLKYGYDLTLKNEVILGGNTLIFILKKIN